MNVYGIIVKGRHSRLVSQRLYGVSENINDAMQACLAAASDIGWEDIVFDDVNTIGTLDFISCDLYQGPAK